MPIGEIFLDVRLISLVAGLKFLLNLGLSTSIGSCSELNRILYTPILGNLGLFIPALMSANG